MLTNAQKTIYKAAAMLAMSGIALTSVGAQAANLGGSNNLGQVYEYQVKYVDNHASSADKTPTGAGGWAMATGVLLGAVAGKTLIGSTLGAFAGGAAGGLVTDKLATATENTSIPTSQMIVIEAQSGRTEALMSPDADCDAKDAACLSVKGCEPGDRALVLFSPSKPTQVIACYEHSGKMRTFVEKHREQPIAKAAPTQAPASAPVATTVTDKQKEDEHMFSGG